jgi:hypothetical protein
MREAFDTVIGLRHGLLRARRLVVIALADGVHNVFWLWHEVRERFEKVLEERIGILHPEDLSTCVSWLQAALSCLAHLLELERS